jgi:hypothetical protein
MKKLKTVSQGIRFPVELLAKVKKRAKKEKTTVSQIVVGLVEKGLG